MDARQGKEWIGSVPSQTRSPAGKRSNRNRVRYFYLNGKLHRVLRIIRAADLMECWSYPDKKSVTYVWSDARRRMTNAFTLMQVSKMIGRHRVIIEKYILEGKIKEPQRQHTLDGTFRPGKYMFSEEDVLGLHDYLMTVHVGRPRKDGRITPGAMPSKAELRAMMRHDVIQGVLGSDGKFVPTWKEIDW